MALGGLPEGVAKLIIYLRWLPPPLQIDGDTSAGICRHIAAVAYAYAFDYVGAKVMWSLIQNGKIRNGADAQGSCFLNARN